ncbi:MAG: TRL-like family protein [Treponema sp.]|jgi:hypothetical protein|nr:TRL-like family protein [Treponema sp.]
MKKAILIVALALTAIALMGCPSVNLPFAAGGATVGAKTGQAEGKIILGLFGDADVGALAAARAGGITKIATVDTKIKVFLGGLFVTFTTTVTGE